MGIRNWIRPWIPPAIADTIHQMKSPGIDFHGDFASWDEAKNRCVGYDESGILERVKEAARKVANGEAAFERDSVLFSEAEYSWPQLAILMQSAAMNQGKLSVLDFGGSLGSLFFQNRRFLESLNACDWMVVEQNHFVQAGRDLFESIENLRFFSSIQEASRYSMPDFVILSSVLQYLEDPWKVIREMIDLRPKSILVDRTGFVVNRDRDRIVIQTVPRSIYAASYPCRFFEKGSFCRHFEFLDYKPVIEFDALDEANIPSHYLGVLFRRPD